VRRRSSILAFLGRLIVLYGLLIAPWPGVESGFLSVYCACASAVFGSMVRGGAVTLYPAESPTVSYDGFLRVTNRRTGGAYILGVHSRTEAYLPLAVFIALAMATSLPWRRRFASLLFGLPVVLMIILGRHIVMVLFECARPSVGLLVPAYPWDVVLTTGMGLAASDVVTSMAASFLVWLVVCLRPRDWESWIGRGKGRTVDSAATEGAAEGRASRGAKQKRSRRYQRMHRAVGSA